MSRQLLRVCQRLATAGYAAVAPDLFWRTGGSGAVSGAEHRAALRDDEVLDDLAFAVAELRRGGAERVGLIGFCMGGRIAYQMACDGGLDIGCAVSFYGSGINDRLGDPVVPLLGFFGGHDEYIPREEIDKIVGTHPDEFVVYEGAEHGFFRDGSDSYHAIAAADAWVRLSAFFDEHLSPALPRSH